MELKSYAVTVVFEDGSEFELEVYAENIGEATNTLIKKNIDYGVKHHGKLLYLAAEPSEIEKGVVWDDGLSDD